MNHDANVSYDQQSNELLCEGDWTIYNISHLQSLLKNKSWFKKGSLIINGTNIRKIDSAVAWLITKVSHKASKKGHTELKGFSERAQKLMDLVSSRLKEQK